MEALCEVLTLVLLQNSGLVGYANVVSDVLKD